MQLKLDDTGDLAIEDGNLVLIDGVDEVAQGCETRLKFFQGEWFLDTRLGVPWFQRILGEKPRLNVVREILTDALLLTPGLLAVNQMTLDFVGGTSRRLTVSFTGQAESGSFDFTKELIL